MNGKVCLVTGGTSGVGRSIATGCARTGATVVIVGRDHARGRAAEKEIRSATGSAKVEWIGADLAELSSVRALASTFRRRFGALHVLAMSAAVLHWRRRVTPAGHETMFATNYLGHFLLANLLLDLLRASAPARVMMPAGTPDSLLGVRIDLDDLMLEHGFTPVRATARAALAKVLFMLELARRLAGTSVAANVFHPGLVRSGLPSRLPLPLRLPAMAASLLLPPQSRTGIWLATSAEAEGLTGAFVVGRSARPFAPAYDVAGTAARLWAASERLAGLP